jgi:ribose 5-phosphate isomerase B
MKVSTVYLAADHGGYEYKNALLEHLHHNGYTVVDLGADSFDEEDDFPQYAYAATAKLIGDDDDARAILVCGSGEGMAIAANRVRGIRAAVCWNVAVARESRQDNNSNVLSIPARFLTQDDAFKIAEAWLEEPFSDNPKYQRRISEIEDIYG